MYNVLGYESCAFLKFLSGGHCYVSSIALVFCITPWKTCRVAVCLVSEGERALEYYSATKVVWRMFVIRCADGYVAIESFYRLCSFQLRQYLIEFSLNVVSCLYLRASCRN